VEVRAPEGVDAQQRHARRFRPVGDDVLGPEIEEHLAELRFDDDGAQRDPRPCARQDDRHVPNRAGLKRPVGDAVERARRLLQPAAEQRAATHRVGRGLQVEQSRGGSVAMEHASGPVDDEQRVSEVVECPAKCPRPTIPTVRGLRHMPGWLCGSHGCPNLLFASPERRVPRGLPGVSAGLGRPPSTNRTGMRSNP
jgi:hypothetical protein